MHKVTEVCGDACVALARCVCLPIHQTSPKADIKTQTVSVPPTPKTPPALSAAAEAAAAVAGAESANGFCRLVIADGDLDFKRAHLSSASDSVHDPLTPTQENTNSTLKRALHAYRHSRSAAAATPSRGKKQTTRKKSSGGDTWKSILKLNTQTVDSLGRSLRASKTESGENMYPKQTKNSKQSGGGGKGGSKSGGGDGDVDM